MNIPLLQLIGFFLSDAKYSGFTIMSFGGSKTSECSDDLRSTLIFDCSKSANWKNKEDISEFTHPQARDPADPCNVSIQHVCFDASFFIILFFIC